ncbi:ABC transporter ATP-binding protein [Siculibacillus lacustris]|uniref:ABC transporter ATP-binding protein n=1 Tax=Siculibacillus lacustris TaxID=1549641 RepID=A0A4Q9VZI9_9HYPH|nr:ABC transporter ATP-binding protein [Siculibacillus lacustris]TBW40844.1 ABC transporter ATP-binding protein [Siculibacillus lacustris]
MTHIRIEGATKRFGDTLALDDVSLDLAGGSFTALLGASGCGKTTLLRLIAGFERPTAGRILFDGTLVCDAHQEVPPEDRKVGVVFQSYALWPHLTVARNIAYPLETRGLAKAEIAARVGAALERVGLGGLGQRAPEDLSGGQRQRVALARCLVAEASVIVFDEPLANLDIHLRASMVESFRDLHARTGTTIVYVTHDQAEALAMADRIAVMDAGRVVQFAPPRRLYAAPRNATVAQFIGRGALVEATAVGLDEHRARVTCAGATFEARRAGGADGPVQVLLRPEALRLADDGLPVLVRRATYRGPVTEIEATLIGAPGRLIFDCTEAPPLGSSVRLAVADAWVIPEA